MEAALAASQNSAIYFFDSFHFSGPNEIASPGQIQICDNLAESGGGVYLTRESKLHIGVETNVHHNQASTSGGGIHVADSSVTIKSIVNFDSSQASGGDGGGVHAINSLIIIGNTVNFDSNQAKLGGGGLSLANSKLSNIVNEDMVSDVNFVLNQVEYGRALYVEGKRECSYYTSTTVGGCFFQNVTEGLMINFNNNHSNSNGYMISMEGCWTDAPLSAIQTSPDWYQVVLPVSKI